MQVPTASVVTWLPLTLHTELDWLVKVTASPEVAVADSDNDEPIGTELSALKVMVCAVPDAAWKCTLVC